MVDSSVALSDFPGAGEKLLAGDAAEAAGES